MKQPEVHPLINKRDSSHYDSQKEPAIKRFERKYSVRDLMAWAKITKAKYRDEGRKQKGEVEADKRKYETYNNYYNMLKDLTKSDHTIFDVSPEQAYAKHNIHFIY